MNKNEFYTSIGLVFFLFLLILFKQDEEFNPVPKKAKAQTVDSEFLQFEDFLKKDLSKSKAKINPRKKGYLGKRKLDPEGWSEKYGKYLKEILISSS